MAEELREARQVFDYSQNHAQNCILGHLMEASGAKQALFIKVLMQRNFVAEFHRENVSFTRETAS